MTFPACSGVAYGVRGRLLIKAGSGTQTFSAASDRYEFESEQVQKHRRFLSTQGIIGIRRRLASRVREGCYFTYGKIALYPSPGYLERLLPFMIGAKGVYPYAAAFVPGDCLSQFAMMIDRDKEVYTYSDCVCAAWELSGQSPKWKETGNPDLMRLTLHIIGGEEVKGATWPSPGPDIPETDGFVPYVFQDLDPGNTDAGDFEVDGTGRQMYDISLSVDNQVEVKFAMSLTPSSIVSTGIKVGLSGRLPWTDANDGLYPMAYTGETAAVNFRHLLNSKHFSTRFDLHNLKVPGESPFIKDEGVVQFSIEGESYGDTSNPEIYITNVPLGV